LDFDGIDMMPVAGAFAARCLAPSKPQFGQSF